MLKNNYINFNKALKPVLIGYAIVIVIGIVLTAVFGMNVDINFKGGTRISYTYTGEVDLAKASKTVEGALAQTATVTSGSALNGGSKQLVISLAGNSSIAADKQEALTKALTTDYKDNNFELYDSNSVSPTIAGSFFIKSLVAVIIAGVFVVIFVGFRFKNIGGVRAALTAYVALILDCIVAFLACCALRLPIDSNLMAVILTLLGYSLNDTIVIYDRVRENKKLYPQKELAELVDESINSVKTRTFITTVTTVLAVITIIVVSEIFGLSTLRSFAIPMTFGLVSGCISSMFVAAPLWVIWRKAADKRASKKKAK